MTLVNELPAASDDAVYLADWLELEAVRSADRTVSYEDLASQIHLSGSTDVMEPDPEDFEADGNDNDDGGGQYSYEVADKSWSEIENRLIACGGDGGAYPFELTSGALSLCDNGDESAYVFQLLLSCFGHRTGPVGTYGERIFEHLSSAAGLEYLGGEANLARRFRFGFPRPTGTNFSVALNSLCAEMNCGSAKPRTFVTNQQQDSKLDVVVWRAMPDSRRGQIIGFGQCATGKNWDSKLTELQPHSFATEWLEDRFLPDPYRMFYLPFCIESDRWFHVTANAGIVFDRCRISFLVGELTGDLLTECRDWSAHALNRFRGES